MVFTIVSLVMANNIHTNKFNIFYKIYNDSTIYPVIYFESGLGGLYQTDTFLLKGKEITDFEKHYRTYSKTYPESALQNDQFQNLEQAYQTYGQLMSYYKTADEAIYVFNRRDKHEDGNRYIIMAGNNQTVLNCGKHEMFFQFLKFDTNYYVFCYDQKNHEANDNIDLIKVYIYSANLTPLDAFTIDLTKLGVHFLDLENESFCVCNNTIVFAIKNHGKFYLVFYDTKTDAIRQDLKNYRPISQLNNGNGFYSIGHQGNKFVIETISTSGEQTAYKECQFSRDKLEFGDRKEYVYLNQGKLYGSAFTREAGLSVFFTYDIENNKWINWWEVQEISDAILMDYKYMAYENSQFYDLYPYIDNES